MTVARSFSLSGMNNEAEQSILSRIRSIDSLLGRISGMEVPSGYGPYDDLEAIPTVFKESPVYLRPLPGVTLRSARFDNNVGLEEENERQTASSYFGRRHTEASAADSGRFERAGSAAWRRSESRHAGPAEAGSL